jgi:cytochrome c oxidase subunit II
VSAGHDNMTSRRTRRRLGLLALPALGLLLASCSGAGPQSALDPRGPIARDIDGLWDLVFVIATVIFFLVMIALVYSMIRFRERSGEERRPKQVHGNTRLEIVWTIIPAAILAVIAVPTVRGVFDLRAVPEGPDVLQVEVIGHQWWWEFNYPDLGVVTANELHIPAGTEVNLTMTSADVIHSFWLPTLNGKRDLVPGRTSNLTLVADEPTPPGEPLYGQCAEFCGLAHADMRFRVFVEDAAGFASWVESQLEPSPIPVDGLAAAGWETFNVVCTACHQATVVDESGAVETVGVPLAPNLTHFGGRTTFAGASYENATDHLARWLANPSDLKPMDPDRNDIPAGRILGMPNFDLDPQQIDGLIALLQSWE